MSKVQIAVYSTSGDLTATLPVPTVGDGRLQHLEWSPAGDRIACWCTNSPAVHIFDTGSWAAERSISLPGASHLARGLIFGLYDLIHVSWEENLAQDEAVSFCPLSTGQTASSPQQTMLDFKFTHAAADLHANHLPFFQEVMPILSPSGRYLAVVDRDMMLHVIKCSTRTIVYRRQINLPPSAAPPEDRADVVSQLHWVRGGASLQITTVIENVDPPLSAHITLIDFVP